MTKTAEKPVNELEALKVENEKLKAEIESYKSLTAGLVVPEAKEGHTFVYISSNGIETHPEKDETGKIVKYVLGDVNGDAFRVQCNKQVEVSLAVAEVLKGIIKKQQSK